VSGSEILNEWTGKQVSIKPATRGRLIRGEVMRSDEIGVLLAVEHWSDELPEGKRIGFVDIAPPRSPKRCTTPEVVCAYTNYRQMFVVGEHPQTRISIQRCYKL
jgi:hypothetical protein